MSRTSKTLMRLGVPTLAAATMIGGFPAFVVGAQAAVGDVLTQTPSVASAPSGICTLFTTTIAPLRQGVTVDVQLAPRTNNVNANFCTLSADGTTATSTGTAAAGATERSEFVTDANGRITFGVIADVQGVVDVTSFVEGGSPAPAAPAAVNNTPETNEPQTTSVLTITQGDVTGLASVDAEPEAETVIAGSTVSFEVRALNSAGQGLAGIEIFRDVTSGPNTTVGPASCGTTDQTGTATCTYPTGGGVGTDTVVAYVNTSTATGATTGLDAGEPSDTITRTTQAALAAGATVELTANANRVGGLDDQGQNPLTAPTAAFTATVRNAAGNAVAGALVQFSFVDARVAATSTATTAPEEATSLEARDTITTSAITDASGRATVTVNNPVPVTGDTRLIRAVVATGTGVDDDFARITYRAAAVAEARNITLVPATTGSRVVGDAQRFNATVVDRFGNPVANVPVTFSESGPGRFVTGSDIVAVTNASGVATAEVISNIGETPGTNTVTATLPQTAGALNDECELGANTSGFTTVNSGTFGTVATGNQPGAAAGTCVATATVTFAASVVTPTASATPTTPVTPSPSATQTTRLTISVSPATITPGVQSVVTVRGNPGTAIELQAYSRPSTTYTVVRRGVIGSTGTIEFRVVPGTNTRLFAAVTGQTGTESPSVVINVRTALSLTVIRNGVRNYTFQGRILPRRAGQLITLYRVNNAGQEVLTAQVRTDSTGTWRITRRFTGSGTFNFIARTGQTLTNAAGASNVRRTAIF